MTSEEHLNDRPIHEDPFALITAIAEFLVPRGIYRVRRENFAVFPDLPLLPHEEDVIKMWYTHFEATWADTYADNPYNFMTNGRVLEGVDSELTFHLNTMESVLYVSYGILNADGVTTFSYPLTLRANIKSENVLIDAVLYFEAIGDIEQETAFYDSNVYQLDNKYPMTVLIWKELTTAIDNELQFTYKQDMITKEERDIWRNGIAANHFILNVRDRDSFDLPTISIYSNEQAIDGKDYDVRANITLMEAAFQFRYETYQPFDFWRRPAQRSRVTDRYTKRKGEDNAWKRERNG